MVKYRASKLEIRDVSRLEEREFLDKYHYQGYIASKVCRGLYSGDELLCLMSFGTPRYNKKYHWELLRLCTKDDCQVYGGASKLLKDFRNSYSGSIISYCNKSKFSGKVYESIGFTYINSCKSYHYEKDGVSYHRSNFQKWKCLKMWPEYVGKDITEKQIMEEKGYTRIEEIQATYTIDDPAKYYIYEIEIAGYHYIGQHKYVDLISDKYMGSGTILQRAYNKYGVDKAIKTIIIKDIQDRETANKYEKCAIFCNRLIWKDKNINIQDGAFYRTYTVNNTTRRPQEMIDALNGNHNVKGKHWYNNGINNVMKFECPEGFVPGRIDESKTEISHRTKEAMKLVNKDKLRSMQGKHHTEESKRKISEASKGNKYAKGNSNVKGRHYYNNGQIDIMAFECPEGFVPGRLYRHPMSEETKQKISNTLKNKHN